MVKNNSDALAVMSDSDIDYLLRSVKREIFKLEKKIKNYFTKDLQKSLSDVQIEYCYIKRESDVRIARQQKHQEYLKKFEKKPFQKENRV